jgi:thiol-disulfide isomerase/thioredoxin
MRTSTRWSLAVLAVLGVLALAFALELTGGPGRSGDSAVPAPRTHRDADTPEALAEPRRRADLPSCPADGPGPGPEQLRSVVVECAADGTQVDVARVLADRTVVLNLWAYWCGPCAEELPAMQAYQRRVGTGRASAGPAGRQAQYRRRAATAQRHAFDGGPAQGR